MIASELGAVCVCYYLIVFKNKLFSLSVFCFLLYDIIVHRCMSQTIRVLTPNAQVLFGFLEKMTQQYETQRRWPLKSTASILSAGKLVSCSWQSEMFQFEFHSRVHSIPCNQESMCAVRAETQPSPPQRDSVPLTHLLFISHRMDYRESNTTVSANSVKGSGVVVGRLLSSLPWNRETINVV